MGKPFFISIICIFCIYSAFGQKKQLNVVTTDVDHFWEAYDKITTTKDTLLQQQYLQQYYIGKGTEGLKNIMEVRRYSAKNYLDAINQYPLFWKSIRKNTLKSKQLSGPIEKGIAQLKKLYPSLTPVNLYFTMGAFRTNGTISGHNILIGAEMALADKTTVISELPSYLHYYYNTYTPINDLVLLATHESVHTQQKPMVDNLLSYCLYEGVAEFVSVKATGKPSYLQAIEFGKANEAKVKAKFESDLFKVDKTGDWLWSSRENSFKMRDLGYYIGYAICENYYEKSANKEKAIREMIELEYENTQQFEDFVNQSGYFSSSLEVLYQNYDKKRPYVTGISPFENQSQQVKPGVHAITLHFSEPMNKENRGFDYGPLGENHVLRVSKVIGFSEDGKSFSYEVELKPNQHYQSLVTNRFCNTDGAALKPYLIDITTTP